MARRFLAPEVLQISSMDCGVAAISCMLAGFGRDVSYERLREACQTSVDGTSIDALEDLCLGMGLDVCQHVVPADLFVDAADARMPLVAVTALDGATSLHYVCVWRRVAGRLQIMDPRGGRRWATAERFAEELMRHPLVLPIDAWRDWISDSALMDALRARARRFIGAEVRSRVVEPALASLEPAEIGAVDAALRLVARTERAATHPAAFRDALFERALAAARRSELPDTLVSIVSDGENVVTTGAVFLGPSSAGAAHAVVSSPSESADGAGPPALQGAGDSRVFAAAWRMLGPHGRPLLGWLAAGTAALALATTAELVVYRAALDAPRLFSTLALRGSAALTLAVLTLALLALEALTSLAARKLGRVLELELRMATLSALPRVEDAFVRSRPISDLAYRAHSLSLAGHLVTTLASTVRSAADVLVTLVAVALLDVRYALVAAVGAALFAVPWALSRTTLQEVDTRLQIHASRMLALLLDALRGIRPVRLHGFQDALRDEQQRDLEPWRSAALEQNAVHARVEAGYGAFSVLVLAALFLVFVAGRGDPRMFVLLALWSFRIPPAVRSLVMQLSAYPLQRNAVARMLEVSAYEVPSEEASPGPAEEAAGVAIEARRLCLTAGGSTLLDHVDLSVPAGQHVAIVGPSGAGKSSLVGALLGFHAPSDGELAIDGRPMSLEVVRDLREVTAWIDPSVHLWNDSLEGNLEYAARGGGRRPVLDVLEEADLLGVLAGIERGLETPLGSEGAFVSGGEGQRVRVGRALLRAGTRLAILDEPFRGLERTVRTAMLARVRAALPNATMLFVSHDIASALAFDRVLVVDAGGIVEDGVPSELAAQPSRFAAMLASEREVLERAWSVDQWRVLRVEGGEIREAGR